jgi:hydrogenase maturation protease
MTDVARAPHLVIGIGNELFTDEGLGVAAARRLAERGLPGVEALDGATLGLRLLPEVEGRETLLVLDAVVDDALAPGELAVLEREELERRPKLFFSVHQLGILEVLAAATFVGRAPARVAAIGMAPASLETGYGLSPTVESRLEAMVDLAAAQLAAWDKERTHA